MDNNSWIQRWKNGETGFHQAVVNDYLIKHWNKLNVPPKSTVFIPLCGKTLDILWLAQQNLQVIGVEISDIAIKAFFEENSLTYKMMPSAKFDIYESENIKLLCGDFFALSTDDFPDKIHVFDRASLIALQPKLRKKYAEHLIQLLPRTARILLICMEYPQSEMDGPPFSVSHEELKQLYNNAFHIELIKSVDILTDNPRFIARGLSTLTEKVYQMTKR